jgi:geranylgeranyl reductase family protein
MEHRDAVIVGAGPAGSSCARTLRQGGVDVLVIDRQKFPRDKTCAGWITPGVLDALELSPEDYGSGRVIEPISAFRVGVIGGGAVDVRFDHPVSYGIRRCEFDHLLIERSRAEFRPATDAGSLLREGTLWVINGEVSTPLIVGAGGTSCPVARLLNTHPDTGSLVLTQETEIEIDPARDSRIKPGVPEFYFSTDFSGYGWVLRKGRFVTVGLGRRDSRQLHDHLRAFIEFLEREGRAPDLRSAHWRGHSSLLYGEGSRRMVVGGALLVGDAAGFANPSSGEGIKPAIESGILAAQTILEAKGDYCLDRLDAYRRRIADCLGPARAGRGLRRMLPLSLELALGRRLVTIPWFARHIVLERWFLHQ